MKTIIPNTDLQNSIECHRITDTPEFFKGTSFDIREWEPGYYYHHDEYVIDYIYYDNIMLVCTKTHIANSANAPKIEWIDNIPTIDPTSPSYRLWKVVLWGVKGDSATVPTVGWAKSYDELPSAETCPGQIYIVDSGLDYVEYVSAPSNSAGGYAWECIGIENPASKEYVDEKIASLGSSEQFEELSNKVASMEETVSELDAKVDNIETLSEELDAAIDDLESEITSVKESVSALETKVEEKLESVNTSTYSLKKNEGPFEDTNIQCVYQLVDSNDVAQGDDITIYKDSALNDVRYENQTLTFEYTLSNGENKVVTIDVSDFISNDELGLGLESVDNKIQVKISENSENYLSVDESGLKIQGIAEINTQVTELQSSVNNITESIDSYITKDEATTIIQEMVNNATVSNIDGEEIIWQ